MTSTPALPGRASSPPIPPGSRATGSYWPLAVAMVFCTLILSIVLSATFLVSKLMDAPARLIASSGQAAQDMLAAIVPAFRPHVEVQTLVLSTLQELKATPKLVVLTATINATVEKSSTTTWGYVNFGTTTVRVQARDNKVQYVIPLQDLATSSFQYHDQSKKLLVILPRPRLDPAMVSVQSDPSKIDIQTANGWATLDSLSGAPLRDEARAELRTEVICEGIHPLVRKEADEAGRAAVTQLLKPIADQLRDGVTLEVHFQDEAQ